MLGDAFNTTVIVVQTLQAQVLEFNTIQLALVNMVALTGQSFGIYTYWKIQQRWGINTKSMLSAVAIGIVALDVWGMIGIWTQKIGYHHRWEFWLYQGCYGFFVCPWYSYSQTMVRRPSQADISSSANSGIRYRRLRREGRNSCSFLCST